MAAKSALNLFSAVRFEKFILTIREIKVRIQGSISLVSKTSVQCNLITELISEYFDDYSEFAQIVKQIQMLNTTEPDP